MCGVVGALVFDGGPFTVTEPYLARMRDVMSHRGPDGAGAWISPDGRVGLGHRRLAIIDLSPLAAQPMANEDGTILVSFNGEIYNHARIRAELEKRGGHRWRTDHSDTEVILHAFEEWGIGCLERFRGMFAFALWDARRRELWLVRDRIGVKPLYYSVHDGRIVFASEIKALLLDPDQLRAVDEESFFHYLSFLTVPAPRTLFEGVRKLPGGTWLRVTAGGGMEERRWWDVLDGAADLAGASEEDIAGRLLAELRTAVTLRKVSDVPVGVFLSGGIDSSTNAALFSEGEGRPVRTFTIGYEGDNPSYPNEMAWARRMAREVGAEHHERILSVDDLVDFLPRMTFLQDEPIADPVCVPLYYVSKLARDSGVVVCQVGEGADELFCGYPSWKRALEVQRYADIPVPRWGMGLGLPLLRLARRGDTQGYEWLRRASLGLPVFWGGAESFTDLVKRRLLAARLREKFADLSSWEALAPIRRRFEDGARGGSSPLDWMTYLDLNLRLPELLLMRVDKMSMGVSLEGRVPFLDHEFVALAMGIPATLKTKGGVLKYILKKAVRGVIPDDLIDRPKQGFGVPTYEWFFGRLGEEARRELEAFCARTDYFDPGAVRALLAGGNRAQAWYLLNFALWHKEFIG